MMQHAVVCSAQCPHVGVDHVSTDFSEVAADCLVLLTEGGGRHRIVVPRLQYQQAYKTRLTTHVTASQSRILRYGLIRDLGTIGYAYMQFMRQSESGKSCFLVPTTLVFGHRFQPIPMLRTYIRSDSGQCYRRFLAETGSAGV